MPCRSAVVRWFTVALVACAGLSAMDQIDLERTKALIVQVRSATACAFIRNGSTHDVTAAAQLLEHKLNQNGAQCATAEAFIDQHCTRSSTTGQEYQIRSATGAAEASRVVLLRWLPPRPAGSASAAP